MQTFLKWFICTLISLFLWSELAAQNLGNWQIYPSFSTINDISVNGDIIYSATLGGIFVVEGDQIISQITSMDGLYRSNPTALIFDEENNQIYAGYVDGNIDVIDMQTNTIERLEDIKRVTRFNSKTINSFNVHDDKLYVSTAFGIVIYTLENLLVESSFLKLGNFDTGIEVNEIEIANNTIYAATVQGVAVGNIDLALAESSNWQTYSEADNLPVPMVDDIAYFNTKIYALSGGEVYEYENSWNSSSSFTGNNYTNLSIAEDQLTLAASTNNSIRILQHDGASHQINPTLESNITDLFFNDQFIVIGTSNEGLYKLDSTGEDQSQYVPTGPYLNFFSKLMFSDKSLVATSSTAFPSADPLNPIRGYYIFEDNEWDNYNINTSDELDAFNVGNVYSIGENDSSYFFGSWGDGIVEHKKSTNTIKVYDTSNSNLEPIKSSSTYIVISDLQSDSDNNMWAANFYSNTPLFVQLNNTEEWIPFDGESGDDNYFNLFIDSYDQKWISLVNDQNSGRGLLVMDTGNPEDANDDISVKLTASPNNGNLPDEKINAIIEDKNGEVWIGTGRGIAKFIFPELIIDGSANERRSQWLINEDTTEASRYLLRDINVTAMAVNDANQKWIGSENQGLWLLNEEGSSIIQYFTTENSDLISNNIESIAIDNETGVVYVATELGLVSFQDVPLAPVAQMEKLKVFPNPFEYNRHNQIVIEGLSEITKIRVLGIDGVVVNELTARGGRTSWNGLDYNGNELGSGVYFVVAYQENGRETGKGKVVIIR